MSEVFSLAEGDAGLRKKVVDAASYLTDGETYSVRVRLADLRLALHREDWTRVSDELRSMQLDDEAVLMTLDNPAEVHDEDREASVDVAGERRHIVYFAPPGGR